MYQCCPTTSWPCLIQMLQIGESAGQPSLVLFNYTIAKSAGLIPVYSRSHPTTTDSSSNSDTTKFQFDDFSTLVSNDYSFTQSTPEDIKTEGFGFDPMFFDFSAPPAIQSVPPLTSESGLQGL